MYIHTYTYTCVHMCTCTYNYTFLYFQSFLLFNIKLPSHSVTPMRPIMSETLRKVLSVVLKSGCRFDTWAQSQVPHLFPLSCGIPNIPNSKVVQHKNAINTVFPAEPWNWQRVATSSQRRNSSTTRLQPSTFAHLRASLLLVLPAVNSERKAERVKKKESRKYLWNTT